MSQQTQQPSINQLVDSSDVTTLARLLLHVKQNNIAYLIAMLVSYQMGILDKFFIAATGVCS